MPRDFLYRCEKVDSSRQLCSSGFFIEVELRVETYEPPTNMLSKPKQTLDFGLGAHRFSLGNLIRIHNEDDDTCKMSY
jgi:hypothetical protein